MKHLTTTLLFLVWGTLSLGAQPTRGENLSHEARARRLLQQMTLEEKVSQMQNNSVAIPRLGIPAYEWWNEALHGIARAGLATVFPQTIGLAASFDEELVEQLFTATSDEARAKHRDFVARDSRKRYEGLSVWTPNINLFRDPRWGRGQETYGEDPYLTSRLGLAVVRGLQGDPEAEFDKLHACAKHFAVHSGPEWNRHSFDACNISQRDLRESYLPAFEALVREGGVKEVMGAYNRFEGVPCNASHYLLGELLRKEWGFQGVVVSDCSAIRDFYFEGHHETHRDAAEASAAAVRAGCDLECGNSYRALVEAVERGLISEEEIDRSVMRLLVARFEMGHFEPEEPFAIPYSVVDCEAHRALARRAAEESFVLLQNRGEILPLDPAAKVALVGPNADNEVMQWGNYNGTPSYTITLREGLEALLDPAQLIYEPLCGHTDEVTYRSLIGECRSLNGEVGFEGSYWNNLDFEGEKAATQQLAHPFHFCAEGNTVFAPGVALSCFSARYTTQFAPQRSGRALFRLMTNEQVTIRLNGEVVAERRNNKQMEGVYGFEFHKGDCYDIEVEFRGVRRRTDDALYFDMVEEQPMDIEALLSRLEGVDVVLFAGGISPRLEGEEMPVSAPGFRGGDRESIELPEVQRRAIQRLHEAGKRVVLVHFSGSAMALEPESRHCEAILQAWYPGQEGGRALAEVLYGKVAPSGKLPVTFYRHTEQLPDFEDYRMQGHTYRYFEGSPLFPFGHGLTYGEIAYTKLRSSHKRLKPSQEMRVSVWVENRSERPLCEVVQLYIARPSDNEGPQQTLRGMRRVEVAPHGRCRVDFTLSPTDFAWFNPNTERMEPLKGEYEVRVGGSSEKQHQLVTCVELQ